MTTRRLRFSLHLYASALKIDFDFLGAFGVSPKGAYFWW
jgi:hypothetical protein